MLGTIKHLVVVIVIKCKQHNLPAKFGEAKDDVDSLKVKNKSKLLVFTHQTAHCDSDLLMPLAVTSSPVTDFNC